jgi:hypothetical protein
VTLTMKRLVFGILALAVSGAVACAPEKPAAPTFAKDVRPIFEAHCNRCHSARGPGGAFLGDPVPMGTVHPVPQSCHLDFYEGDPATCAPADGGAPPPSCTGAKACAGLLKPYIEHTGGYPMPPPPASKLTDWEIEVIDTWAKNPMP